MILAGLLLLAVGGADLARASVPLGQRRQRIAAVAAVLAVVTAGAALSGVAALGILVPALCALGWLLAVPSADSARRARAGVLPVILLIALVTALLVIPVPIDTAAPLWQWWAGASLLGGQELPVGLLTLGVAVFLTESANLVVRSALAVAEVPGSDVPPRVADVVATPAAESMVETRSDAETRSDTAPRSDTESEEDAAALTAPADVEAAPSLPILKGGRIIGPLERLLIMALALAGAFTVVAALFAAKGIVRFPEISRDPGAGDRAEYFLVGSMVSWTIAFAAAGLLWFGGLGG